MAILTLMSLFSWITVMRYKQKHDFLVTIVCLTLGDLITGWGQNWMFSPTQGCLLGKYKPFGEKNSFLACKKIPILSVFTNMFLH